MRPINSILLEQFQNQGNAQVQSNLRRAPINQIEINPTDKEIVILEGTHLVTTAANLIRQEIIVDNPIGLHEIIIPEETTDSHSNWWSLSIARTLLC